LQRSSSLACTSTRRLYKHSLHPSEDDLSHPLSRSTPLILNKHEVCRTSCVQSILTSSDNTTFGERRVHHSSSSPPLPSKISTPRHPRDVRRTSHVLLPLPSTLSTHVTPHTSPAFVDPIQLPLPRALPNSSRPNLSHCSHPPRHSADG
jgi:hypothetical protein